MSKSFNGYAAIGTLMGFSVVVGMLVLSNKELKSEAEWQIKTALRTTGKLVAHYKKGVDGLTSTGLKEDKSNSYSEWDKLELRH